MTTRTSMTMLGLAALLLASQPACTGDEASAPTKVAKDASPAKQAPAKQAEPPTDPPTKPATTPAETNEDPKDANLSLGPAKDTHGSARSDAVLTLLSDGLIAERLPVEASDPGLPFEPRLAERLAPKAPPPPLQPGTPEPR